MCFQEGERQLFGSMNTLLSSLGQFEKFFLSFSWKYIPIMCLSDITEIFFFNVPSKLLCHRE